MDSSRVVIVMPAYNAARTLRDTYSEIPKNLRRNIILVDDHSFDNTVAVSRSLKIHTIVHPQNRGYGGNQKTCYTEAFKLRPDVVVMLHPDYQYDASLIGELIRPIAEGRYDFMFGSRISDRSSALKGGMPRIKYYVNRVVCIVENIALGVNFTEHFSGFRAYSIRLLKTVPFQKFSDDFIFDQQMVMSALIHGFRIGEVAIPTRYHEKASSIGFVKGTKFIAEIFWNIFLLKLHKLGFHSQIFSVKKR